MKATIEITDQSGTTQMHEVESSALYDALARMVGLIEIGTNVWVCEHGEHYVLTKYGFKRIGINIEG